MRRLCRATSRDLSRAQSRESLILRLLKSDLMAKLNNSVGSNGKAQSPVLSKDVKNYMIDIDGTICDDIPNEEPHRMVTVEPYPDALEVINKWYSDGHVITYFTSRTDEHRDITKNWLKRHGFKYHHLVVNKPRGGNYHWIDNHIVRATRFKGKFTDLVTRKANIEVFKK